MPVRIGPVFPLAGYLLGSISTGLILAGRRGVDLRRIGSGNTGATNVGRALGTAAGRSVLALDALKGFAPTLAARVTLGAGSPWTSATGMAAATGHCFPLWHGLRGGKGAATAAGALLAVDPAAGALAGLTYVVLRKVTRRASVGSLGGAAVGAATLLARRPHQPASWMALGLTALVVMRHRGNIARLLEGTEPPS